LDAREEAAVEREAGRVVAAALRLDAAAQDAGDFEAIAKRYDEVYAEVLSLCSSYPDTVATGFTFWDWWADARNHDWKYYEGIARDDWSRLARHVADSIEAGRPISDPVLIRHFERARRPGPFGRLRRLLGW
jgi:hypothetical protein